MPTRPTKPPAPALLRQAAIMRAHGQAWEAVAKDVGLSVRTVQLWPQLHPRRWAKATTMAQTELTDEAVAESMRTLRRQLRSEDDKVGRDAAQKLLAYGTAVRKAKGWVRSDVFARKFRLTRESSSVSPTSTWKWG